MKYMAIIEKGPNSWGAYVPDLPGCARAGKSRDEVVGLIKEAIQFHLEGLKADGAPLPLPNSEIEYIDVTAA
jgi:predicted RNase H-like HicB family nuclease